MARRLPNAGTSAAATWAHDWFPYEQYQVVHQSYMDRLRDEGLVARDSLSFYESEDAAGELVLVVLRGRLVCSFDVLIRADKKMLVMRDAHNRYMVRTRFYQYHAMVRGRAGQPRRDLSRIDNAHEGHLHRHLFDGAGAELETVELELDAMPTLDQFVRDAVSAASE